MCFGLVQGVFEAFGLTPGHKNPSKNNRHTPRNSNEALAHQTGPKKSKQEKEFRKDPKKPQEIGIYPKRIQDRPPFASQQLDRTSGGGLEAKD